MAQQAAGGGACPVAAVTGRKRPLLRAPFSNSRCGLVTARGLRGGSAGPGALRGTACEEEGAAGGTGALSGRRGRGQQRSSRGPGSGRCSSPEDNAALGRLRLFGPWGALSSLGSLSQALAYRLVSFPLGSAAALLRRSCFSAEASVEHLGCSRVVRPARAAFNGMSGKTDPREGGKLKINLFNKGLTVPV